MRWRDSGIERLPDPDALGRWFTAAGLTSDDPPCTATDLGHAHRLREATYRLLLVPLGRGRADPDDLDVVNSWAARPAPVLRLLDGPTGLSARPADVTTARLLAGIARDAVDLLGGPDRDRLRECANPRCSLLFVDTSRAGARRWCSMGACGSRDKMARYRAGA